jgi:cytochrome c-type biogenesis protein CcmH/NrfG
MLFSTLAGYAAAVATRRTADTTSASAVAGGPPIDPRAERRADSQSRSSPGVPASAEDTALGPAARAVLAVAGLCILGWTGHGVWERTTLGALFRPQDPFRASPETAQRLLALLEEVKRAPSDPEVHADLGVALAEARRFPEAAHAFRAAAALSPGRASVIRNLALVEGLSGEFQSATGHLRLALESYPGDASLQYLLAYSAFGLGDIATAIRELETLLEEHPHHPQGRLLLEKLRE